MLFFIKTYLIIIMKAKISLLALSFLAIVFIGLNSCSNNSNSDGNIENSNQNTTELDVNDPLNKEIDQNTENSEDTPSTILSEKPDEIIDVKSLIPNIIVKMKYATTDNFTGKKVPGYNSNTAYLHIELVKRLELVQKELNANNLSLVIYDAYRPQKAVNSFVEWSKDPQDILKKEQFYPNIKKEDLFKLGYIASKSKHSAGLAVDVNYVILETGEEVDMGTPFDFFGPKSSHSSLDISNQHQANRSYLRNLMTKYGFEPYDKEWWHYSLSSNIDDSVVFNFDIN